MRRSAALLIFVFVAAPLYAFSCGPKNDPPPNNANATATYPPPTYNTGATPPNTYNPPPPNTGAMPPPTGAPQGQLAVPGPLALPCQNDGACITHRCNVQYGKCAAPCQTPVDCAPGNNCFMGVCAPKPPGSP